MPEATPVQRYVALNQGGFYAWDVELDVFWADENFAKIMGFSQEEMSAGLPASRMMALIHDDDKPFVADAINKSVLSGEPFQMVYRVRRDDGFAKITEVGKCYRQVDGVATLFTGIVFDACPISGQAEASNVNIPTSV